MLIVMRCCYCKRCRPRCRCDSCAEFTIIQLLCWCQISHVSHTAASCTTRPHPSPFLCEQGRLFVLRSFPHQFSIFLLALIRNTLPDLRARCFFPRPPLAINYVRTQTLCELGNCNPEHNDRRERIAIFKTHLYMIIAIFGFYPRGKGYHDGPIIQFVAPGAYLGPYRLRAEKRDPLIWRDRTGLSYSQLFLKIHRFLSRARSNLTPRGQTRSKVYELRSINKKTRLTHQHELRATCINKKRQLPSVMVQYYTTAVVTKRSLD